MPISEALKLFIAARSKVAPDEQRTTLKASYSNRTFTISGLDSDESVFGSICKNGGAWEPHIMNVIAKIVPPNAICLDIGANIGAHTLILADVAVKGCVYAFEPSTLTSSLLAKNIRQNKIRNAHCQTIGLGAKAHKSRFANLVGLPGCSFVTPDEADAGAIINSAWGSTVEHTLETVTIDTLDHWAELHRIKVIDFIKMDVEGFEWAVLDGGRATFERYRPNIIIEFNKNALTLYFSIEPQDLYRRLSDLYEFIYVISDDLGEAPRRVLSYSEIEPLLEMPGHWWVDLLCQTAVL